MQARESVGSGHWALHHTIHHRIKGKEFSEHDNDVGEIISLRILTLVSGLLIK